MPVADLDALHTELQKHDFDYARPGISDEDWGRAMVVVDPFHYRLVFHQPVAAAVEPRPSEAAAPIELTYDLTCSPELGLGRVRPAHRRVVALRLRARGAGPGRRSTPSWARVPGCC